MAKLSLTRVQRRALIAQLDLKDYSPASDEFSEMVQKINQHLVQHCQLTYSEHAGYILKSNGRPDNYWGEVVGDEDNINWLLLHL